MNDKKIFVTKPTLAPFSEFNNILNVKRINGNHHVLNNNPQILCDKLINDIIINKY